MTELFVSNESSQQVTVYITLGATPGCVQDVAELVFSPQVQLTKMYPLMGHFPLAAHSRVQVSAKQPLGLNGNISFNTPPMNCPTPDFPDGVNLAEFIINNGFQQYGQETIDISCVAGANCLMGMELSADDWTTNGGRQAVKSISNLKKLDNTGRVGVFPYGCDNCTSSDNPPGCVGKQPDQANKEPICNVQRPAGSNSGGSVTVVFSALL